MTDRELAEAAWLELTKTTDPYPTWKRKGFPASSHWAKARALLDQIGVPFPPPPPPPPPPTSLEVPRCGVSVGSFSEWRGWDGPSQTFKSNVDHNFELDQIAAIGAKVLRFDVKATPATGGSSAWLKAADRMVASCHQRQIEPLLILGGQMQGYCGDAAYRNEVAIIRDRYVPMGVRLFETPNEPNLNGWSVADLVKASLIAYDEVHKAQGTLLGVGGLAYPADAIWSWASQLIPALGGKYDAFTWHPYNDPYDPSYDNPGDWSAWAVAFGNKGHWSVNNVRNLMAAHGGVKPFWATECGDRIETRGLAYQASAVSHALTDSRVELSCVYTMLDDDVAGFGLLDYLKKKRPAWDAYKAAAS